MGRTSRWRYGKVHFWLNVTAGTITDRGAFILSAIAILVTVWVTAEWRCLRGKALHGESISMAFS